LRWLFRNDINKKMALKVVDIETLKAQMRVDFDDEDALIELYGEAAEDVVIRGTRRSLDELRRIGYEEQTGEVAPEELPEGEWFPTRLKLAVLMMAAHSYRNREPVASVGQNVVPYAFDVLVKPYRKLTC
jgi:hypothetical protein